MWSLLHSFPQICLLHLCHSSSLKLTLQSGRTFCSDSLTRGNLLAFFPLQFSFTLRTTEFLHQIWSLGESGHSRYCRYLAVKFSMYSFSSLFLSLFHDTFLPEQRCLMLDAWARDIALDILKQITGTNRNLSDALNEIQCRLF